MGNVRERSSEAPTHRELPQRFRVAFSYASEQYGWVASVAENLERRLGPSSVFLDKWFEHYTLGDDLAQTLQQIYAQRTTLVVICHSKEYGTKRWTGVEYVSLRSRQEDASSESDRLAILDLVLGPHPEYLPPTIGTRDVSGASVEEIAQLIERRLGLCEAVTGKVAAPRLAGSLVPTTSEKLREAYLRATLAWVDGRLERARAGSRLIELDMRDEPLAVLPTKYRDIVGRRSYPTLKEAFAENEGRLLVLGRPGAGKTTALLQLARYLLEEAASDTGKPVPILVNLSKFQLRRFTPARAKAPSDSPHSGDPRFEDWLSLELAEFGGVPLHYAKLWLRDGQIAALLDGLDEFPEGYRDRLVQLLNDTFLHDHPVLNVVACSRSHEYQALVGEKHVKLRLRGAIELEPLGDDDVRAYLEHAKAESLLHAVSLDETLRDLSRSPLTLAMLTVVFSGATPSTLTQPATAAERSHQLFEAFVGKLLEYQSERALERRRTARGKDEPRALQGAYSKQQVYHYLGWLAVRLSVGMRTSFSIETLHEIVRKSVGRHFSFEFLAVYLGQGFLLALSLLVAIAASTRSTSDVDSNVVLVLLAALAIPALSAHRLEYDEQYDDPEEEYLSDYRMAHQRQIGLFLLAGIISGATAVVLAPALSNRIPPLLLGPILHLTGIALVERIKPPDPSDGGETFAQIAFVLTGGAHAAFWAAVAFDQGVVANPWLLAGVLAASYAGTKAVAAYLSLTGPARTLYARFEIVRGLVRPILMLVLLVTVAGLSSHVLEGLAWFRVVIVVALAGAAAVTCWTFEHAVTLLVLGAVVAVLGGATGGTPGIILAIAVVTVLGALFVPAHRSDGTPPRPGPFASWFGGWVERRFSSRCLWLIAAVGRRFPMRKRRFLGFCDEATLIKTASPHAEEFWHRRLRDHFAVHRLLPQVSGGGTRQATAIDALGYQGEAALDLLSELAEHADAGVRAAAVASARRIASPSVTHLLERRLDDTAPEVRRALLDVLLDGSVLGSEDLLNRIIPLADGSETGILVRNVRKNVRHSRHAGAHRLVRKMNAAAVRPLLPYLDDEDRDMRMAALELLSSLRHPDAVDPLIRRLEDAHAPIRRAAVVALMASEDPRAVPAIIQRLDDPDPEVRAAAATALYELRDPTSIDALIARLDDANPNVRHQILRGLGRFGDPGAADPITERLNDRSALVRRTTCETLRLLGHAAAADALANRLSDTDLDVRSAAAVALMSLGDRRGTAALSRFARDERSSRVRRSAVNAFRQHCSVSDHALLTDFDAVDDDDDSSAIDPRVAITRQGVESKSWLAGLDPTEAQERYEELADILGLNLDWRQPTRTSRSG